jgi:hypothetical protein
MKEEKAVPFEPEADPELVERLARAMEDYRWAVRLENRSPVTMPRCTCCPVHHWPIG